VLINPAISTNLSLLQFSRREKRKIAVQNLLNKLNCALMAERLITSDRHVTLAASLRLIIVMLDGGNMDVQNSLYIFWLGTSEERFFYCVQEHIRRGIMYLREAQMLTLVDMDKEDRHSSHESESGFKPLSKLKHHRVPHFSRHSSESE
jgi:hypothetical protein